MSVFSFVAQSSFKFLFLGPLVSYLFQRFFLFLSDRTTVSMSGDLDPHDTNPSLTSHCIGSDPSRFYPWHNLALLLLWSLKFRWSLHSLAFTSS